MGYICCNTLSRYTVILNDSSTKNITCAVYFAWYIQLSPLPFEWIWAVTANETPFRLDLWGEWTMLQTITEQVPSKASRINHELQMDVRALEKYLEY